MDDYGNQTNTPPDDDAGLAQALNQLAEQVKTMCRQLTIMERQLGVIDREIDAIKTALNGGEASQ